MFPEVFLILLAPESHLLGILISACCSLPPLSKGMCSVPYIFGKDPGKLFMGTPCLIVKHNVQSQLREDAELISIEVSFCRGKNEVLERCESQSITVMGTY